MPHHIESNHYKNENAHCPKRGRQNLIEYVFVDGLHSNSGFCLFLSATVDYNIGIAIGIDPGLDLRYGYRVRDARYRIQNAQVHQRIESVKNGANLSKI